MRKAAFAKKALGTSLAVGILLCRTAVAGTSVPLRVVGDRLVVVPVMVNGRGPFDFLLDTGTNTTVVDPGLAEELGIGAEDRVSMITPGGERIVPRGRLESVTVGPKTVEGLEALWADLPGIRRVRGSIRGILGQQFLSRFNYLLSYKSRRLEFEDGGAIDSVFRGTPLPFDDNEGRILVTAPSESVREKERRFVLDSGASQVILFDERPGGLGSDVAERAESGAILTSQDSLRVRTGTIRTLSVGGLRFDDVPVILVHDEARAEARMEDGLLPTNLFAAVYFNNREGFVLLNPRR
jgi:predicted aspartyl protease